MEHIAIVLSTREVEAGGSEVQGQLQLQLSSRFKVSFSCIDYASKRIMWVGDQSSVPGTHF